MAGVVGRDFSEVMPGSAMRRMSAVAICLVSTPAGTMRRSIPGLNDPLTIIVLTPLTIAALHGMFRKHKFLLEFFGS
jgi:hypothetical protein